MFLSRQKWRENDVWMLKSPVDSANTLGVKNFVEIALSRSVSEEIAVAVLEKSA